jgi:UDP-N-acetylglucosamine 2-epimerase
LRILTVIGARPQFIKAAPLSAVVRARHREVLVHTGQHYDHGMSRVFFDELGIPEPDYDLGVGSGPHGAQTGAMMSAIEEVILKEQPHVVLVYGDTNSTLAGALAAAKLHCPVAHVEAGLRSFNRAMPEEINRVVADHVSTWLFAPSPRAERQLRAEGIDAGVHVVGDIMNDAVLQHGGRARVVSHLPGSLGLASKAYFVSTVHRAENTDTPARLSGILAALGRLGRPVVLPLHPRTRARMDQQGVVAPDNAVVTPPLGYLDTLQLVRESLCVLTDSGGLQKEAYYLGTPCVTLRTETEWVETVEAGWNIVAGTDPDAVVAAVGRLLAGCGDRPPLYGDGHTAERIVRVLEAALG